MPFLSSQPRWMRMRSTKAAKLQPLRRPPARRATAYLAPPGQPRRRPLVRRALSPPATSCATLCCCRPARCPASQPTSPRPPPKPAAGSPSLAQFSRRGAAAGRALQAPRQAAFPTWGRALWWSDTRASRRAAAAAAAAPSCRLRRQAPAHAALNGISSGSLPADQEPAHIPHSAARTPRRRIGAAPCASQVRRRRGGWLAAGSWGRLSLPGAGCELPLAAVASPVVASQHLSLGLPTKPPPLWLCTAGSATAPPACRGPGPPSAWLGRRASPGRLLGVRARWPAAPSLLPQGCVVVLRPAALFAVVW